MRAVGNAPHVPEATSERNIWLHIVAMSAMSNHNSSAAFAEGLSGRSGVLHHIWHWFIAAYKTWNSLCCFVRCFSFFNLQQLSSLVILSVAPFYKRYCLDWMSIFIQCLSLFGKESSFISTFYSEYGYLPLSNLLSKLQASTQPLETSELWVQRRTTIQVRYLRSRFQTQTET